MDSLIFPMNFPRSDGVPAHTWHPNPSSPLVLFSNVDTLREIYARHARRDLIGVFELLSPDIEIAQTIDLPWGGHYHGLSGAEDYFARLSQHADSTPEPLTYVPAGDDVAVIGKLRGTARATGKAFAVDLVHVWTVHQGKALRCISFVDTPAMLEALGT